MQKLFCVRGNVIRLRVRRVNTVKCTGVNVNVIQLILYCNSYRHMTIEKMLDLG